jgi:hypothetical protein
VGIAREHGLSHVTEQVLYFVILAALMVLFLGFVGRHV